MSGSVHRRERAGVRGFAARGLRALVAAVLAGGLLGMLAPVAVGQPTQASISWLRAPANVAHALGGLAVQVGATTQIYTYTNCREAFEQNYAKGYRIFECDFAFTAEGRLVARHDWSHSLYQALGEADPGRVPTHAEFMAIKPFGTYTPLDVEGVVALLRSHPDAFLITDTKASDKAQVRAAFAQIVSAMGADAPDLSQRIIVQIYKESMLGYVRSVYPFPNVIYTLYQRPLRTSVDEEAIAFAASNGIRVVTMDGGRWTSALSDATRARGMAVAVNTVDSQAVASVYNAHGVRFLYSDALPAHPLRATPFVALFQLPIASDAKPIDPSDD